MKKSLTLALAVAALGSTAGSTAVMADEGNFMMRIRAVNIDPIKDSTPVAALGLPANDIYVASKVIPEVDFTYFLTKNIAAELVLTYPQELTVKSKAAGKLGKFDALPPTLTLQYHFAPDAAFRPYVGAGINYTAITNVKLNNLNAITGTGSSLSADSWGGALQIGFDYKIGQNSYINFDLKKVYIQADAKVSGLGKVSTVKLDPVLLGIGYGFRF